MVDFQPQKLSIVFKLPSWWKAECAPTVIVRKQHILYNSLISDVKNLVRCASTTCPEIYVIMINKMMKHIAKGNTDPGSLGDNGAKNHHHHHRQRH